MTESTRRWRIKKFARRAVMLGSLASASIAVRGLAGGPKIRVLTYHRFGHAIRDPWCVAPDAFAEQMRWLSARGLAVSLDDVMRFARGDLRLPRGSVLVTIDDGFSSVLSVAAPILRKHGIPAVAFITTSVVGDPQVDRGTGEAFLTWDQIAALSAAGLTIGSHGHSHRSMAKLDTREVQDEGLRSKQLIEAHIGKEVTSFAYPFGMRGDESPATARILAECGYGSVFVSQHGTVQLGANTLRLPRIKVESGEPLWMFKLQCKGGIDAWGLVDRLL